jgi:hypothetical protein
MPCSVSRADGLPGSCLRVGLQGYISPTRRYMPRFRCAFIIPSRASMCTL